MLAGSCGLRSSCHRRFCSCDSRTISMNASSIMRAAGFGAGMTALQPEFRQQSPLIMITISSVFGFLHEVRGDDHGHT